MHRSLPKPSRNLPQKSGRSRLAVGRATKVRLEPDHPAAVERTNSDRAAARTKLASKLDKYTDLYDFAPVGYFCLDEQGRILEANLTAATLLGVDRSRLIHRRLQRFVTPPNRPEFLAFLNKVFTQSAEQVYQVSLKLEDGVVFWANLQAVKADSRPGEEWCRVTVSDITGLKQAEEELRRSSILFSGLIQQAPIGIYVVDERLRLLQVNPRAQPVFAKIHPLIGRDLAEIIHLLWPHRFADTVLKHFHHTAKTGQPYGLSTFTERRRDTGRSEAYEWQLQRITLPAGRHGVVCFFTNITERKATEATHCRIEVLAATNRKLEQEIMAHQVTQTNLSKGKLQQRQLLAHSQHIQEQLRRLSHQVLQAQETERQRISRELNDDIAQILAGINDHLATLASEPRLNVKGFQARMAHTQKLVADSVTIIQRFARDLRPPLRDGEGLISALRTHLDGFARRTKIHLQFKPSGGVEQLSSARRTVVYRVVQAALANIAQHAQATRIEVSVKKIQTTVCVRIHDNGTAFEVKPALAGQPGKRLGLLGMREWVEMVGGHLSIVSAPGKGTTVCVRVPESDDRGELRRSDSL